MRSGRRQTVALDMHGAALALQSVFYQRQWAYPIMLTEPAYPTVNIYPTQNGRWIMINGGYPGLRDGLLDLLQCADSKPAVSAAVSRWNATDLEDAAAAKGLCAVIVRTPEEWRAHPQGQACGDRAGGGDREDRGRAEGAVPGAVRGLSAHRPAPAIGHPRARSDARDRRPDLRQDDGRAGRDDTAR